MSTRASLRPELARVVGGLLAEGTAEISLDAIGEALGVLAVTADEIDQVMAALEAEGRTIGGARTGQHGETLLHAVLGAARALRTELGRAARAEEIAPRSGLTLEEVRHALALARVIQR